MFDVRPAALHPCVFRRQALDNTRLSANGGDGLADIIVQFARHIPAHALLGFQQAFRQTMVAC